MDSGSESSKRVNIEDLPKEELIKRCKHLLMIAQKAKHTKDALQEENNKLREQINEKNIGLNNATEEIIENLTQQKLSLVTSIEDFKCKNSALESKLKDFQSIQEKLNSLEIENVSYKRQLTRATEENEQLLSHLETLEKQIDELNRIGIEQRAQLLELEKSKQEEHNNEDIALLENKLSEKDFLIEGLTKEVSNLKSELDSFEELTEKNISLSAEVNSLKECNEKHEITVKSIQDVNNRMKEKLKLYHSKLVKFATNTKSIKEEKNEILKMFKLYTEQVKDWKEQLNLAGNRLVSLVKELETENTNLKMLNNENCNDLSKCNEYEKKIKELNKALNCSKEELATCNQNLLLITEEKDIVLSQLQSLSEKYETEIKDLNYSIISHKNDISECVKEKTKLFNENEELHKLINENNNILLEFKKKTSDLEDELNKSKLLEKQFAEKSSEEIVKLVEENKLLNDTLNTTKTELNKFIALKSQQFNTETQTDEENSILKSGNSEILMEMNEMNQALKERGETISKLKAHCEEIKKKLQVYEAQANKNVDSISEKEETIKHLTQEIEALKSDTTDGVDNKDKAEIINLKNEIEVLKEKLNNSVLDTSYSECDTMSTSTISRSEEVNRLKDLEGSWEERYGKLRSLAIKLKGKIREQNGIISTMQLEKEEVQKKLSNALKSIQTLQSEYDQIEDKFDSCDKERKDCFNKLNKAAEEISKSKKLIVEHEETICKLEKNIQDFSNEKLATENWKKQVSAKVQTLRKELEAKNLMKKELDSKISKLNSDLALKEKSLKQEIENHGKTKTLLEQSNTECKKNSMLNLEMQDYERSIKDISLKYEKKQDELENVRAQLDSQKSTANALREQNKILEERLENQEVNFNETSQEVGAYKKKIAQLEDVIQQKDEKLSSTLRQLEDVRSENEELSTELSKVIAEHQKTLTALKSEKEHLRSQNLGLQQSLREVQDTLRLKEDELSIIQGDYESYKVRAQSVLRQNQSRDVGMEEKLLEEVQRLRSENEVVGREVAELGKKLQTLQTENENLTKEKSEYLKKCEDFESQIEQSKHQYTELSNKHQKSLNEHAETVRSLKVHADTLSQCYRQQIQEQEVRHNREIIELQSKIEKAPSPTEFALPPPITQREEGEGSESIESSPPNNLHPVPLERLLGSDLDQKMGHLKKQLSDQESKVVHLTAILSDTEQDLAKHVQMNKMLKEEIRRQQRSVEREKHAENLEYLKNVVFKFVTLNSGDERVRLVPVLNTILKLSPDESQKLNSVAKGEKGWSNYLPSWSSPNKPQ